MKAFSSRESAVYARRRFGNQLSTLAGPDESRDFPIAGPAQIQEECRHAEVPADCIPSHVADGLRDVNPSRQYGAFEHRRTALNQLLRTGFSDAGYSRIQGENGHRRFLRSDLR